jgi:hypothetical protein
LAEKQKPFCLSFPSKKGGILLHLLHPMQNLEYQKHSGSVAGPSGLQGHGQREGIGDSDDLRPEGGDEEAASDHLP